MERIDRKIAEAEHLLVRLASEESIPQDLRSELIPIVEHVIDARKSLKVLMLRSAYFAPEAP